MAGSVKTLHMLFDSVTLVPSTPQTVNQSLTTGYGGILVLKITNGGTGPTFAANIKLYQSDAGTNYDAYGTAYVGSTANGAESVWTVNIPIGIKYLRITAGDNTDQNVTVRAYMIEVTKL